MYDFSAQDFILLLLSVDDKKHIKGKLFLQKEMFLIEKEVYKNLEGELNFIPYHYGPYSKNLADLLDNLKENDLIIIDNSEGNIKYSISEEGEKVLKTFPEEIVEKVTNIKVGSDKLGYKGLLRYVYFNYPYYTIKSKIKEEVLGE